MYRALRIPGVSRALKSRSTLGEMMVVGEAIALSAHISPSRERIRPLPRLCYMGIL